MPQLSLSTTNAERLRADALIVGLYADDENHDHVRAAGATAISMSVVELATMMGAKGRDGEVTIFPAPDGMSAKRIMTVGLGPESEATSDTIRRAAGTASRAATGFSKVVSTLALIDVAAAAQGHVLGTYDFATYKAQSKPAVEAVVLHVNTVDRVARQHIAQAQIIAGAVQRARDFVNTAPNDLYPASFAARAGEAARNAGLNVQVLTEKALEKGGYGGILGVGSGSSRPPRLVRITYKPAKAKASVALVGKGVTFDSGGLSLKPAAGMENMTSDMAGAAAVIATVIAAAELALPVAVTATVPMAENLPSGTAYRPGDVLRMRGGKTVHILNTDAEGRLILADAITRACEDKPDYLLETSTLTGAQMVALGSQTMGVMGSAVLRDRVAELGREIGEDAWAMPLPAGLRRGLESPLADLANVSQHRWGGMLVAGHFLSEFVSQGTTWAHLDVAGPSFHGGKSTGYTSQGATGVPVRTLLATLMEIASGVELHDAAG